jgi:hypothetical protein
MLARSVIGLETPELAMERTHRAGSGLRASHRLAFSCDGDRRRPRRTKQASGTLDDCAGGRAVPMTKREGPPCPAVVSLVPSPKE